MSTIVRRSVLSALAAITAACGGSQKDPVTDVHFDAVFSGTPVPKDVACIRVNAAGARRAVVLNVDFAPGQAATITLHNIPTGNVLFSGSAFANPCGAVEATDVPTWLGVDVNGV